MVWCHHHKQNLSADKKTVLDNISKVHIIIDSKFDLFLNQGGIFKAAVAGVSKMARGSPFKLTAIVDTKTVPEHTAKAKTLRFMIW